MAERTDRPIGLGETRDRLEAIRKRAQEATAGPWIVREYPWRASSLGLEKFPPNGPDLSKQRWVATEWVHGQTEAQEPIWCRMASPYGEPEQINTIEARDAVFIANAREDVPWLLGEVSRLRERVKELEAPRMFEKVDELALALRVLEDHDMMEEAEKLQRRASPSPAPGDQEP